ncbi:MAG: 50S ribosomal protein L18Ae [Halobacteriota archaeon]
MSQFTVRGQFQSRGGFQAFTREIEAVNESVAEEHVLSQIGSEHGLKRTQVEITDVSAE